MTSKIFECTRGRPGQPKEVNRTHPKRACGNTELCTILLKTITSYCSIGWVGNHWPFQNQLPVLKRYIRMVLLQTSLSYIVQLTFSEQIMNNNVIGFFHSKEKKKTLCSPAQISPILIQFTVHWSQTQKGVSRERTQSKCHSTLHRLNNMNRLETWHHVWSTHFSNNCPIIKHESLDDPLALTKNCFVAHHY